MNTNRELLESQFESACSDLLRLQTTLENAIVGQKELITGLLTAFFAGGHILLEGLPGLGKTHLAKALSAALGVGLARIQCTPDLMPADITGSEILRADESGAQRFEFRRGPIFSSMVLVDEINRAMPKTQAAMLEAMQETQVTHAGIRYPLPDPFWVVATQNPIEIEGTYLLPEAQLDRFTAKIDVGYPREDALHRLIDISLDDVPADHIEVILQPDRVREIITLIKGVVIAHPIKQAAIDLILATHPSEANKASLATRHIRYGSSPRGLQTLLRTARVNAVLNGRVHTSLDDIHHVALPVLRHRILLNVKSELEGVKVDELLHGILEEWRKRH